MLIAALGLVALPFVQSQQGLLSRNFIGVSLLLVLLAASLNEYSSDHKGLSAWLAGGKQHYQLLETFTELGGVDGAITSIQQKLKLNQNDTNGWVILGKLYLSKNNVIAAHDAFAKAHNLAPQNGEIAEFFESTR